MKLFIIVARFMAGSCFGFVYITTLVHIGDNVPQKLRGYVSTTLAMTSLIAKFSLSISHVNLIYVPKYVDVFKYTWIMMSMIIITLCLTLKKTPEPLTWYLQSKKVHQARNILKDLWDGIIDPIDIQKDFDEKVKESEEEFVETKEICFIAIFTNGNWKPIVYMLLLRLINVSVAYMHFENFFVQRRPLVIVLYLIAFIPVKYGLDTLGRKHFLYFGILSGVFPLVGYGIIIYMFFGEHSGISIILFVMFIFFWIPALEPVMHVYSVEAFPLSKRNASLAFVTSFDYILNGLVIGYVWPLMTNALRESSFSPILWVFAMFPFFLALVYFLPETKRKSIRQCRAMFSCFYPRKMQSIELA